VVNFLANGWSTPGAIEQSYCNHPHNLLWMCPSHHTAYDHGHRIHANLKKDVVRAYKTMLQEGQLRRWRIERRATHELLLLIQDLETARMLLADSTKIDVRKGVEAYATRVLEEVESRATAVTAAPAPTKPTPRVVAYAKLARTVATAVKARRSEALEALSVAKAGYLRDAEEAACPLCDGKGSYGRYETCPVCGGDAVVDAKKAASIDVAAYASTTCPLCSGSGHFRDYDRCPECGGEGELSSGDAEQVDLTAYRKQECPLCGGKGGYGEYDRCPECGGEGKMERRHAERVDLHAYEAIECPLCEGSGTYGFRHSCPVCEGATTVERNVLRQVDVRDYELVECPRCDGNGDGGECRACDGRGKVERQELAQIQEDFRQVKCPICGNKTMDAWAAERLDTPEFTLVDCPECEGSGTVNGNECRSCSGECKMERRHADRYEG
jgi:DnaJ-class molecular chaperone